MANQYSADVPKGFNVPKQVRLDSITGIQNEATLKNLGSGNNLAFKYYEGLKIYCKDEKTEYVWRQVIGSETGLLTTHFVYPTYSPVDGIDYSGKSFNFFLVLNSGTPANGSETKINAGTNTTVTGVGTIASPYVINSTDTIANGSETKINEGYNVTITGNGTTLTPYIINADLSDLGIVKTVSNEVIAPGQTLSIINNESTGKVLTTKEYVQSVIPSTPDGSETKMNAGDNITITGTGTTLNPYIVNSLSNGKEITSSSLIVTEDDFSINIEVPTLLTSSLKTFYVNINYTPTIDSPSDGSIIRPYLTYDEAKTAFIGTGTIITPQYIGSKIVLQTNSSTTTNPTVNNLSLEFENNSTLTYTGTNLYMFDTEVLYPLIPKGVRDELSQEIVIKISGKGTITRDNGIGLVRGMGSDRNGLGLPSDNISQIRLGLNSNDEITLLERTVYPSSIWDGDITDVLGVPLEDNYGFVHQYSLQLPPTSPLIYCEYSSAKVFTYPIISDGNIIIKTLANTALKVVNTNFPFKNVDITVEGSRISTISGTKMTDRPTHYEPHPTRYLIELNEAIIYCNQLGIPDSQGYSTTGVDSLFKITNNGNIQLGKFTMFSNMYVNKFLNVNDITNTNTSFNISTNLQDSSISFPQGRYFLDTQHPTYNIIMPKSNISGFSNKATTSVNIIPTTYGTLSSFFGNPVISGILNYADDTAATTAGLITNSLYFNTTNNAIDKI